MKLYAAAVLLASTTALFGQVAAPGATRKQILQNSRVTVSQVDIPPGTAGYKHDRDTLTVIVGGGRDKSKVGPGEVFLSPAGSAGPTQPAGKATLRAVMVEFASPQGAVEQEPQSPTRYCNPGSKTACVDEKYLLCTAKVCVEEVRMGAGAVTTKHSHDTDHMIIAVSDYSLADDVVGKGVVMRDVKSGGVEYTPAGITHTLTNKSGKDIRFVVVVFR
jgi:quercetin dioxygenase-like cupin family protein